MGQSADWKTIKFYDNIEVVLRLLDNGADHNLKYLHNIQHYKQNVATEAVQLLLDNGADHKFKNHNII